MSVRLSVRLPQDLADWLRETSRRSGLAQGEIIRAELERARGAARERRFMRLAGHFKGGPRDLSMRKGFSPS